MDNLSSFIILFLLACSSAQVEWKFLQSTQKPEARRDAGLGLEESDQIANCPCLVLFGGRGGGQTFGDTWLYDITAADWIKLINTTNPEPRFSFVYAKDGQNFYIFGGEGAKFFNDVWNFDFSSQEWTKMYPTQATPEDDVAPLPRYGSAGGIYEGKLYIALGFSSVRYGDTFAFDLQTSKWEEVGSAIGAYSPFGPHPRCLHSGAFDSDGTLVIFGGCLSGGKTGGPCPAGDVWALNTKTKTWTSYPTCASPRMYSAMAVIKGDKPDNSDELLFIYGGTEATKQSITYSPSAEEDIVVLETRKKTWSTRKTVGTDIPKKRSGASLATAENGVYMFGGHSEDNDLWILQGTAGDVLKSLDTNACNKFYFNFLTLHGIFMFLAWGVLLPAGAIIARYMREVKPPLWFQIHRINQCIGIVMSIIGFAFAITSVMFDHFAFAHGVIGIIIVLVGIQQPINGFLRAHKQQGEPKTTKRFWWEIFHMNIGRLALILGLINITLGLYLADTNQGTKITWFVYMVLLILFHIIMELYGLITRKCAK